MTNNIVKLFGCLLIFLANFYSGHAQSTCDILSNFNSRARESFSKKDFTAGLSPLDNPTRCILEKSIDHYLDRLNNRKLMVIDSFFVRSYPIKERNSSFSFVATTNGNFYFTYLPLYDHYWITHQDYDYNNKTHQFELKKSFGCPVRLINSPMVDDFFNKEVFVSADFKKQLQIATDLLPVIFQGFINNEVRLSTFLESIRTTESQKDFESIKEKIDPIISRRQGFSATHYLIFSTPIGFLLLDFYIEKGTGLLRLDFYLILKKVPMTALLSDSTDYFPDCYK